MMKNITLVNIKNIDEFLEKVNEEKQESCSCCESFDYSNPKRYCRTRSYSYYDDCVYGDYDYYDDSDDISAGQNYSRKLRGYRRRKAKERFRGQRDNQPGNCFHRDRVHYTWESRNDHQESKVKVIQRGYDDYLDDIEEKQVEAEAKAEAEAEAYLRFINDINFFEFV